MGSKDTWNNVLCGIIVVVMAVIFVAAMVDGATGHGLHLNDYATGKPVISIEPGSFDGTTLQGTNGKCYIVVKDGEQVGNDHFQLHLREVDCK
jgi:hypothetical protein